MKKIMIILTALFTMAIQTNAMSYDQAREHALFLTDKMAYELNLTDDQYEAAYEINLDYLMSIGSYDDLYGRYWTQRNLDLSYILFDWQYNLYVAASYFYRPLTWSNGFWRFVIYSHYPRRDYLYFGRPHFYTVYRGGHSWRTNNGRSWYQGRSWGGPSSNGQKRIGMRDNYDKGNFKSGNSNNRNNVNNRNNNYRNSGNNGSVNRQNNRTSGTIRNSSPNNNRNSSSTTNKRNSSSTTNKRNNSTVGNQTNSSKSTSSSSFGGRSSSTRTTVNQNRSTNINRSSQNSSIGSKPSSTFSSKSSSSSRSSSSSHSSGSKGGGGNFGGGRK